MKQRAVLVSAFVLMIVFVLVTVVFFSSALSARQNTSIIIPTLTPTPTLAPTPTPTPIPTTPTPTPSPTPIPLVNGLSASLLDVASGRTLLSVNSHMRLPMWSTTKLMTALLTIERLSPDTMVTVQQAELDEVPSGMSIAFLQPNDRLSVRDLLYALLLPSGSDAAIVLAHAVSGNTASFVSLMNARAQQLGLTDTHYSNPHGAADPGHYSSAADLVKLARVAMGYSFFAQIVSAQSFHLPPTLYHHKYPWDNILNPFLQSYPGANGIKTGSDSAGDDWCMVFSAYQHGRLLIGAEMHAPSQDQVIIDAKNILDKGFTS